MSLKLRYGLLAGLTCGLMYATTIHYSIGIMANPIFNKNILLVLAFLFLALLLAISGRKKELGSIDFNEAMKTGLAVSVLTGVITSIIIFFYFHSYEPGWFIKQCTYWKATGVKIPQRPPAKNLSVIVLSMMNILGAFITLILSFFLKSRDR
jgi:hypothetical protein